MRVYVAQIDPVVGDLSGNGEKVLQELEKAKQQKADLLVFPEMVLTGYPPQDLLLFPAFLEKVEAWVTLLGEKTEGITLCLPHPKRHTGKGKGLYNAVSIYKDRVWIATYHKRLLPTYDVFNEARYFDPGEEEPKVVDVAGMRVAITICEDMWNLSFGSQEVLYRNDPIGELQDKHVDLVLNIAASPYAKGKRALRTEVAARVAKTLKTSVLFVNQVGGNDGLLFDGSSFLLDQEGRVVHAFAAFKEDARCLDLKRMHSETLSSCEEQQELFSALVMGVSDYFKKLGFQKAVLGLSGGIDSALVAVIAKEALGQENVCGVLMPSCYSSEGSLEDATLLATTLGIEAKVCSIESLRQHVLETLLPFTEGDPLEVTEENIQSRLRGLLLMAVSNQRGALVLNTGNKSELAVGYATLYGDMIGALSVLGDLTKEQVYRLARFVNRSRIVIPQTTLDKPPTAELKPLQTDEDTLPPYPILDQIVTGYVEEHLSPEEIAHQFSLELSLVQKWVNRINQNEYKRGQAPPVLKVTSKAFQLGRHYPIVTKDVWKNH